MPTKKFGGQGAPLRKQGAFVLEYRHASRNGRWTDRKLTFEDYAQALAKYESIDNTASLWNNTIRLELCVAKTRVAYYSVWSHERGRDNVIRLLAAEASEPDIAVAVLESRLKRTPWVLKPETVMEISVSDYKMLQSNNPWPS